jgi:hypothetical protein
MDSGRFFHAWQAAVRGLLFTYATLPAFDSTATRRQAEFGRGLGSASTLATATQLNNA